MVSFDLEKTPSLPENSVQPILLSLSFDLTACSILGIIYASLQCIQEIQFIAALVVDWTFL